jgi:hypothetical protein
MPVRMAQQDNVNGMMEAACPQAVSASLTSPDGAPRLHPCYYMLSCTNQSPYKTRETASHQFLRESYDVSLFRFQYSKAGPFTPPGPAVIASFRRASISSMLNGVNRWANLTTSSSCPVVLHPTVAQ